MLVFQGVFRQFLTEFSIFLNTGFRAEIPINRDRVFRILYCRPRVESIKLMTIIEAKMGQNGRRSKCATFY